MRRLLFLYLFIATITLQVAAAIELAGYPLNVLFMKIVLLIVAPLGIGIPIVMKPERRGAYLRDWPFWFAAGLFTFGLWVGSYFLVGAVIQNEYRTLREVVELPLLAPFSLIYLGVDPVFMLPFLSLERGGALRRAAAGNVFMVIVSVVAWSLYPVMCGRPVLPEGPGFGMWLLHVIWGADRPVNCLPSTHCAMAIHAALLLREWDRRVGAWAVPTALLICVSTLFTRQHYSFDVITGFMLGVFTYYAARWVTADVPETSLSAAPQMARTA